MTTPVQKACVWNIDTGAAFKGPLTIMDIDTKGILAKRTITPTVF
jgi:serine/threonine protein phosphatase 1